jgi:hypothetical protein
LSVGTDDYFNGNPVGAMTPWYFATPVSLPEGNYTAEVSVESGIFGRYWWVDDVNDTNTSTDYKIEGSSVEGSSYKITNLADGMASTDAVNKGQLDSEASARAAGDLSEQSARIAADLSEQSARVAADLSEQSARIAADLVEQSARVAADSNLQSQINSILSNTDPAALDSLSEIVEAFQSADNTLNGAITSLAGTASTNLNAEISARQAADLSEQSARIAADLEEVSARQAADSSLQSQINSLSTGSSEGLGQEISDRQAADLVLQGNIDEEVSARQAAVTALANGVQDVLVQIDGRVAAVEAVAVEFAKEKMVLTATDVSNGYVDLAHKIVDESLVASVDRLMIHQDDDYSLSVVNDLTRVTFAGNLVSPSEEQVADGDILRFTYAYLAISQNGGGGGGGGGDLSATFDSGIGLYNPNNGTYNVNWFNTDLPDGSTVYMIPEGMGIPQAIASASVDVNNSQGEIAGVSYDGYFFLQVVSNGDVVATSSVIRSPAQATITWSSATPILFDGTSSYTLSFDVSTNRDLSTLGVDGFMLQDNGNNVTNSFAEAIGYSVSVGPNVITIDFDAHNGGSLLDTNTNYSLFIQFVIDGAYVPTTSSNAVLVSEAV